MQKLSTTGESKLSIGTFQASRDEIEVNSYKTEWKFWNAN